MLSAASVGKAFRIVVMLALALSLAGAASVLIPEENAAGQVEPMAVIAVEVDPAPPNYVVNDGTMSQGFRWTIQFSSTPDHYTFELETYPGGVPVPGTFMNVDISGESSPVHNPEWTGYHEWDVPLGQASGTYIARVEYFSDVSFEQAGESVFYVRDKAHLTAVITAPADGSTYNTCEDFTVSATITNTGNSQGNDTYAELIIDANASVVAGANPQPLGDLAGGGGSTVATWTVHCDSEGDSVLTVDPTGIDGTSGEAILEENTDEASITVHQVLKAHLTAVITDPTPPEYGPINTCTDFTVTATITNTGDSQSNDTYAELIIDANASVVAGANPQPLGDLSGGGGSAVATWTVHCDSEGDSVLTVDPTGIDANTGVEIIEDNTDEASITVHQVLKAHLTAVITDPTPPEYGPINTCTDFTVTAEVTNSGQATAQGVAAELLIDANASVVAGANPQPLGDLSGGGGSAVATWTVHCDSEGDSVLTVDPTGIDANTGVEIIEDNTDEASITVHQVSKAHLTAVITAPADGSTYNTCTDFTVTATVSNTGQATAEGVAAELVIDANASVVAGANPQPLGDLAEGESAVATWTVHCDSEGDSVLTVDPTGIDANTGVEIIEDNTDEASITVHQRTLDEGCTLTFGYWKTHSKYGPAPYDDNWANVAPDGEDSDFFDTGKSWYQVLWTPPKRGNAYYILAHQYIAAYLNQLNGASVPPEVAAALNHAEDLLDQYDGDPDPTWLVWIRTVREDFISTAELLDDYNNGYIGPRHCSE